MGIFFLIFEKLFGGWDHLQIDMIRPLELFQICEVIHPSRGQRTQNGY